MSLHPSFHDSGALGEAGHQRWQGDGRIGVLCLIPDSLSVFLILYFSYCAQSMGGGEYYDPHFTDEKTEAQKGVFFSFKKQF